MSSPIRIESYDAWRAAVSVLLDRLEWVMPATVAELRDLLLYHPSRGPL